MSKISRYSRILFAACVLSTQFAEAASRSVNSTSNDPNTIGTLSYWLLNANSCDTIDCDLIAGQSITLTSSLPALTKSYTINGAGITVDGANNYQAFQVVSGNVTINNVNVQNTLSKGGDGGNGYSGGGGAVGGGGALYIHKGATVTLATSSLINNVAQGGNGGAANNIGNAGAGGGGGFGGGNGGSSISNVSTGGGGGGHSNGGNGGSGTSTNGSNGVYFGGGGGGAGINSVAPGGSGGNASPTGAFIGGAESAGNGGGGAGNSQNGFSATGSGVAGLPGNGGNGIGIDSLFGAGGGGGASSETGFPGANGVGAAGGGGGSNYSGGNGGVLGGGGGAGLGGVGGNGGFGAGGGGALTGGTGGGGFGAGGGNGASSPSSVGGGGGGSGLGGAIFLQNGASLIVRDVSQISNNIAFAGVGGTSTDSSDPNYAAPGDGAAKGFDIFMRDQSSITFDISDVLNIPNPIEGENGLSTIGGLSKIGKGILKLNGHNNYSGITTVDEGTLNLNGSVIGDLIVGTDGKLSGNATVSGDLTSSGILSPGNSIGIINTTNLVLTPSNRLEIELASNGAIDRIAASNTAQIDGTLEVIQLPSNFKTAQSHTFIAAADGITGTFSEVQTNVSTLLGITYNPTTVVLEVLPISALTLNSNAAAAASCYATNGFLTGSDVQVVNAALLTLGTDAFNTSFNQMQPSQFSGLAWTQIENALLVRSSYLQHLEHGNLSFGCYDCPRIWGEAVGAWQNQNSHGQQFGYTDWTGGATVGLDTLCCDEFRLGVATSYTHSHLDWKKSAGHANINSYYGGGYANWTHDCGYINSTLLGAYSRYHTDRHLHFSSIKRHAKSTHNSWEGLAGLEAGFNLACYECLEIVPFVRVDYIYLSQQEFGERGAKSLNLRVNKHRDQVIQSEVGAIWTECYAFENCCVPGTLVPRVKLSYINDAPLTSRHLHARFAKSDCGFSVKGLRFYRNLGAASVGLTYLNCESTLGLTLRYDGEFNGNYNNQAARIALDFKY